FALWDLIRMGEYAELSRRGPALLAEAQERGDRYAATNLSTHILALIRLAGDDPAAAQRQLREVMGQWSQQGFHIQHHNALRAQAHAWLAGQEVRHPARMVALLAPGYPSRESS